MTPLGAVTFHWLGSGGLRSAGPPRKDLRKPSGKPKLDNWSKNAAPGQWLRHYILARKHHHVEHVVEQGCGTRSVVLKGIEGRPSGFIKSDDLAINHRFVAASPASALTMAGYFAPKSLSLRERRWTFPPVLNATARKPANFTS